MGIGFSIFLLAAGAVLAFAVHATVAGLDIRVVGWILMAAGAIGLALTMVVLTPRKQRRVTETRSVTGQPAAMTTTTESAATTIEDGPRGNANG